MNENSITIAAQRFRKAALLFCAAFSIMAACLLASCQAQPDYAGDWYTCDVNGKASSIHLDNESHMAYDSKGTTYTWSELDTGVMLNGPFGVNLTLVRSEDGALTLQNDSGQSYKTRYWRTSALAQEQFEEAQAQALSKYQTTLEGWIEEERSAVIGDWVYTCTSTTSGDNDYSVRISFKDDGTYEFYDATRDYSQQGNWSITMKDPDKVNAANVDNLLNSRSIVRKVDSPLQVNYYAMYPTFIKIKGHETLNARLDIFAESYGSDYDRFDGPSEKCIYPTLESFEGKKVEQV